MQINKITHSSLFQIMNADIFQQLRSKWFWTYSLLFGGFVAVMFTTGITESQIIGFVGLSRLMVTFMQVSMVILPIYVLITTVRSVVGDRESNVMEYMLSLPVSFTGYFWGGKFLAKFLVTYIPVFIALLGAAIWGGSFTNLDVPWDLFVLYSALLAAMIFCFFGHQHVHFIRGTFTGFGYQQCFCVVVVAGCLSRSDIDGFALKTTSGCRHCYWFGND